MTALVICEFNYRLYVGVNKVLFPLLRVYVAPDASSGVAREARNEKLRVAKAPWRNSAEEASLPEAGRTRLSAPTQSVPDWECQSDFQCGVAILRA